MQRHSHYNRFIALNLAYLSDWVTVGGHRGAVHFKSSLYASREAGNSVVSQHLLQCSTTSSRPENLVAFTLESDNYHTKFRSFRSHANDLCTFGNNCLWRYQQISYKKCLKKWHKKIIRAIWSVYTMLFVSRHTGQTSVANTIHGVRACSTGSSGDEQLFGLTIWDNVHDTLE